MAAMDEMAPVAQDSTAAAAGGDAQARKPRGEWRFVRAVLGMLCGGRLDLKGFAAVSKAGLKAGLADG